MTKFHCRAFYFSGQIINYFSMIGLNILVDLYLISPDIMHVLTGFQSKSVWYTANPDPKILVDVLDYEILIITPFFYLLRVKKLDRFPPYLSVFASLPRSRI